MPKFSWPTAVISGGRDLITPRAVAEKIVSLIPDSVLVELATAGHSAIDVREHAALDIVKALYDGDIRGLAARRTELDAVPASLGSGYWSGRSARRPRSSNPSCPQRFHVRCSGLLREAPSSAHPLDSHFGQGENDSDDQYSAGNGDSSAAARLRRFARLRGCGSSDRSAYRSLRCALRGPTGRQEARQELEQRERHHQETHDAEQRALASQQCWETLKWLVKTAGVEPAASEGATLGLGPELAMATLRGIASRCRAARRRDPRGRRDGSSEVNSLW